MTPTAWLICHLIVRMLLMKKLRKSSLKTGRNMWRFLFSSVRELAFLPSGGLFISYQTILPHWRGAFYFETLRLSYELRREPPLIHSHGVGWLYRLWYTVGLLHLQQERFELLLISMNLMLHKSTSGSVGCCKWCDQISPFLISFTDMVWDKMQNWGSLFY